MAVVMLVTAMLVVVMVIMVVVMIVTRMAVHFMRRAGTGVSATFGVERRFNLDHPRTKPLDHALNDMIAANSQSPRRDLRRQMAITEMPGDANQMLRIVAADFQKRLRRSHDFDQPAVLQHQRVAATQRDRMFEIK